MTEVYVPQALGPVGDYIFARMTDEDKAQVAKALIHAIDESHTLYCDIREHDYIAPNDFEEEVTEEHVRIFCQKIEHMRMNENIDDIDWWSIMKETFGSDRRDHFEALYEEATGIARPSRPAPEFEPDPPNDRVRTEPMLTSRIKEAPPARKAKAPRPRPAPETAVQLSLDFSATPKGE